MAKASNTSLGNVPKPASKKLGGKGSKAGRSKKKALARSSPLSRYVRGEINFETYQRLRAS